MLALISALGYEMSRLPTPTPPPPILSAEEKAAARVARRGSEARVAARLRAAADATAAAVKKRDAAKAGATAAGKKKRTAPKELRTAVRDAEAKKKEAELLQARLSKLTSDDSSSQQHFAYEVVMVRKLKEKLQEMPLEEVRCRVLQDALMVHIRLLYDEMCTTVSN